MILYFTFSYFKQVNIALTDSEPHCSNHELKYCKNTLGVYLLVNVVANNILVYSLNLFPHLPHMNYIPLRKKLYWNHTSAWVFSCKFAAYFQNTFFWEHLWVDASFVRSFLSLSGLFFIASFFRELQIFFTNFCYCRELRDKKVKNIINKGKMVTLHAKLQWSKRIVYRELLYWRFLVWMSVKQNDISKFRNSNFCVFQMMIHTRHVIKLSKLQIYVFQYYKMWERKLVSIWFLKKMAPNYLKKRKLLTHNEEEKGPLEFLSKVEGYYRQFFIKQLIWLPTVFVIDFIRKAMEISQYKYCY